MEAGQVVVDVKSDRRGRCETSVYDRRQCEWSEAVMRESRYGFRGVRVAEASNPGLPRTRARARMEEEAEAVLSGLPASMILLTMNRPCQHGRMRTVSVKRWAEERMSGTYGHVLVTWSATQPSTQDHWQE